MVAYMAFPMPRNLDSARDIIAKQEREITTQQNEITTSKAMADHQAKRISLLEALLRLERARRYGRSSEQYADPNDPQGCLFDEGELEACVLEGSVEDEEETQEVATHTRTVKRGKRGPLPDYLDRERVEHTLPKSALLGPNGECFTKIGEVITEQLDIVPATVRVIEHVRFQYAVKGLDELGVKIAPLPGQPIPKSIATPGLLAHVVTSKYCHHLPLYRQEQIWAGLDVHLPRNTLCRWVIRLGELVQDLVDYQFAEMKQHRHIHVDETRVTVLTEKNKPPDKPSHTGWMWVYANHLGVLYDYRSSRGGASPLEMLGDFRGYVQSDAYSGYDALFADSNRTSVGCLAHARRKFTDVQKGCKKKAPTVNTVLNLMKKLYHLEKQAKVANLSEAAIYEMRQAKAVLVLKQLHDYLKTIGPKAPPTSLLGKAVFVNIVVA